jgi:tRNA U55 pseudouridine synthase TruB
MSALRRIQSHVCRIEGAWTLEAIEEEILAGGSDFLRPLDELFDHLDAIVTPADLEKPIANGVKVNLETYATSQGQLYRLYCGRRFMGLAARKNDGIYTEKLMIG